MPGKKKNGSNSNSNINIHSDNNSNNIGTTSNIYNFDPSIRNETEKINCEKCNKLFASQQTLKTHLLTINCTKENINILNKCNYCEKEFSSKQMLIYHDNVCVEKKLDILTNDYENKTKNLENQIKILQNQILNLKNPS